MKKWVLAVWEEKKKEVEGVLPSNWIIDDYVHWPPVLDASHLFTRRAEPEEKWHQFPLKKVKHTSDKRQECEDYDATTTLESDSEGVKKKRCKPKHPDDNYEYSGVIDDEDIAGERMVDEDAGAATEMVIEAPRPPPKMNLTPVLHRSRSTSRSPHVSRSRSRSSTRVRHNFHQRSRSRSPVSRSSSRSSTRHNLHQRSRSRSPVSRSSSRSSTRHNLHHRSRSRSPVSRSPSRSSTRHNLHHRSRSRSPVSRSPSRSSTRHNLHHRSRSHSLVPKPRSRFPSEQRDPSRTPVSNPGQRHSSHQRVPESGTSTNPHLTGKNRPKDHFPMAEGKFQKRVLSYLLDLKELMSMVLQKPTNLLGDEPILQFSQLTSLEELQELNNSLGTDEEKKSSLIQMCARIGGVHTRDMVCSIMERLMTNALMCKLNMKGSRGEKKGFAKTPLCQLITDCVLTKYAEATEADVRKTMESRLKYAPKRKSE